MKLGMGGFAGKINTSPKWANYSQISRSGMSDENNVTFAKLSCHWRSLWYITTHEVRYLRGQTKGRLLGRGSPVPSLERISGRPQRPSVSMDWI